jgi:hypothetical protein
MNSIKCKNCGLTNFSSALECSRCGNVFRIAASRRTGKPRFSIWSLVAIALVAGVFYYFYNGLKQSVDEVNADEAKRVAAQPTVQPASAGLSRTEYDKQRAGGVGNLVKKSPGLTAHQQHIDETQKAMQQVSNTQPSK